MTARRNDAARRARNRTGHRTTLTVPCGADLFDRASFSDSEVLVDEAAEPVVSVDHGGWRDCPGRWRVPGFWRCEPERPVRPMGVEVPGLLGGPCTVGVLTHAREMHAAA
jgi:hypothetical protein